VGLAENLRDWPTSGVRCGGEGLRRAAELAKELPWSQGLLVPRPLSLALC
jgi:hypothetical protein